jgi:hypothetical protein
VEEPWDWDPIKWVAASFSCCWFNRDPARDPSKCWITHISFCLEVGGPC